MIDPGDSATPTRLGGAPGEAPRTPASDSLNPGRFIPGAMLAGRYRIVGLLGRGGMGEVYRADDLKLAQPVALKFLPEALAANTDHLERFFAEVRLARQIAHPHVCRVYDIAEADGHHFLSMEYVDGEDLSSLLRRIGRLPQDKALQIARQLCAGLAAAHERGVLHRDLKPANVMIDGRGRARITDFGLAAAVSSEISGAAARAGTPGYMAPEQMAGGTVTQRTDVYALGLVLYELFTGKPAFEASTLTELARRQRETRPSSPSSHVAELDPATERAILRCLDVDPAGRPSSALAVASALPGGDPIAAALEAGETPSPEMVAEAGGVGAMSPVAAWSCLLVVALTLTLMLTTSHRRRVLAIIPPPEPPDSMASRARQILRGIDPAAAPADTTSGYELDGEISRARRAPRGLGDPGDAVNRLARGEVNAVRFWYRESPRPITRVSHQVGVSWDDPPIDEPGMAGVWLDQRGRLEFLVRVPPARDPPAGAGPPVDWGPLFAASGVDPKELTPAPPEWIPPVFAHERAAWTGQAAWAPGVPLRIEAAAYSGLPVAFAVFDSEALAKEISVARNPQATPWFDVVPFAVLVVALIAAAFFARRNLAAGRGDRRGAFRLAMTLLVCRLIVWVLQGHHVLSAEAQPELVTNIAFALYAFGTVWLFYIALEPHLRKFWPRMLSSWVRLLEGRWSDPLVGRDLLLGATLACAFTLMMMTMFELPPLFGLAPPPVGGLEQMEWQLRGVQGTWLALGNLLWILRTCIVEVLSLLVVIFVMRVLLRKEWLVMIGATLVLFGLIGYSPQAPWLMGGFALIGGAIYVVCLLRYGLLLALAGRFFLEVLQAYPITSNASAWYAPGGWLAVILVLGVAIYGFQRSLGGRPVFGRLLAEV